MLTDEQIAEIAGKLTEAQKEVLTWPDLGDYYGSYEAYPREGKNGPVMKSLIRMGLSGDGFWDRLTPLGLAVRNHLENSRGTD